MSQAEFVDGSVEGRAVTSDGAERPAFLIGLIGVGHPGVPHAASARA